MNFFFINFSVAVFEDSHETKIYMMEFKNVGFECRELINAGNSKSVFSRGLETRDNTRLEFHGSQEMKGRVAGYIYTLKTQMMSLCAGIIKPLP